ncbi:MAG: amidohydrolase family protein [Saprospiraceae bacterium]
MKSIFNTLCFLLVSLSLLAQDAVFIKNVNVWDGIANEVVANSNVLVIDNLIEQVGQNITAPENAMVIDGKGKYLIPGLSDAHVHLALTLGMGTLRNKANWMYTSVRAAKAAENFLMLGFTTVRDLGGPVMGLKKAIDEGIATGPRIYPSGAFISQTSGHGDLRNANERHPYWSDAALHPMDAQGWSFVVDGVPEVLKASRENLKNGATQLKVMAGGGVGSDFDPIHSVQFTPAEMEAAVQAAKDWDTYVTVHIYNSDGIIRALNAGVKCIEHGHLVSEEAMRLIKEKDAWLVPQSWWTMRPKPDPDTRPPHRIKKSELVNSGAVTEMELAKKYKVKLAYGSDAFGALGGEHRALMEFTSRKRWFTSLEILKQATSGNAQLFALSGKINPYQEGDLGVIKKGAYADLLIYDQNPLEDVDVLVEYKENLKLIMKDGKIIKNEL